MFTWLMEKIYYLYFPESKDAPILENDLWKFREVSKRMRVLLQKYKNLSAPTIIDRLYQMHAYYEMPVCRLPPDWDCVYLVLSNLRNRPQLTYEDSVRLTDMLSWPEVRKYTADYSSMSVLVGLCQKVKTKKNLAVLKELMPGIKDSAMRWQIERVIEQYQID